MNYKTDHSNDKIVQSANVPKVNVYDIILLTITHAMNVSALMANPDFFPYVKYLEQYHEDLIQITGFLSTVFGISEKEIIEYTQSREAYFSPVSPGPKIEDIIIENRSKKT